MLEVAEALMYDYKLSWDEYLRIPADLHGKMVEAANRRRSQ